MKIFLKRKLALLMSFMLLVPLFWNMNTTVAQAATPSFVQTKVEIVGAEVTYQLDIKDKVDKSTYKWTSSNTKVATVSSKGLVTSKDKGTATIKCVITYPSKKTKSLSCKVTVTIPAKGIEITNDDSENGAHVLNLGETMDFDALLTPTNSSDKVYWSVAGGDASCIRIDDVVEGRITATKIGKVILTAKALKSATPEGAALSLISEAIIVEVVGPTATVKSVDFTSSSEIKVVFDSAVNPNTIIDKNNKLTSNIEVTMSKDTKGVLAADPGELTATIAADMKTLTITAKNTFNGYYGISLGSGILTADGVALDSYYKKIYYVDVLPPAYVGTTLDDSGFIATINFSEPLNFNNLKVFGSAVVSTTGATASTATLNTLSNVLNYTISSDKKSMTINLSKIEQADYGKMFQIYVSGVTDLSGNSPANVYLTCYLQTDTSAKPQAKVMTIARSGYNTITVTFDRAIMNGGLMLIDGVTSLSGVVDTTNNKKVNFTFSDALAASYTGSKKVSVGYWNSYNVVSTDTSANKMSDYYIDFTVERTSPFLTSSSYDPDKGILTLIYSEEVTLRLPNGIFNTIYTTANEDIKPNTNINYTSIAHTEGKNILKLQITGANLVGTYSFNLDQGFVVDNFRNQSLTRGIVISNTTGSSSELPAPYAIIQSVTNLSEIQLKFLYKLDKASAETISNYKITGLNIIKAELKENDSNGATVVLTVADGAIEVEVPRPMTITGVRGYNNSYGAITSYSTNVNLKENKRPTLIEPLVIDQSSKSMIRMNFTEAVQGTIVVKVTQINGAISTELSNTVVMNGSTVFINLPSVPLPNSWLRVEIISNTLKDLNGNPVNPMPTSLMVAALN